MEVYDNHQKMIDLWNFTKNYSYYPAYFPAFNNFQFYILILRFGKWRASRRGSNKEENGRNK